MINSTNECWRQRADHVSYYGSNTKHKLDMTVTFQYLRYDIFFVNIRKSLTCN